jgi:hypothetical protein
MPRDDSAFEVDGVAVAETEAAILFVPKGWDNEDGVWIPKSRIKKDSEVNERSDSGTLIIPVWLAEAKDLEDEEKE